MKHIDHGSDHNIYKLTAYICISASILSCGQKDDRSDCNNYQDIHCISLLSIVGKMLACIDLNRL